MKCAHCPAPGPSCKAIETGHRRFCELVDPANPAYDSRFVAILRDEPPPAPSLVAKTLNFAGAVARHVAAGMPTVDDAEKARRLAICGACPNFTPARGGICGICGCLMNLKASWELSVCPDKPPRW